MRQFTQPRQLAPRERELLDFLLTAEFPGKESLREQSKVVEAVGECDCGCGTVDLVVPQNEARPAVLRQIPVEAHGKGVEVLLFVRDGFLASLEIVDYSDARPLSYPKPTDLELWVPPSSIP